MEHVADSGLGVTRVTALSAVCLDGAQTKTSSLLSCVIVTAGFGFALTNYQLSFLHRTENCVQRKWMVSVSFFHIPSLFTHMLSCRKNI